MFGEVPKKDGFQSDIDGLSSSSAGIRATAIYNLLGLQAVSHLLDALFAEDKYQIRREIIDALLSMDLERVLDSHSKSDQLKKSFKLLLDNSGGQEKEKMASIYRALWPEG